VSQNKFDEVNYWPAYVDALINVVLNLLFLVGVFTIGLVALNAEALFTEQKATKLKVDAMMAAHSDRERQKLAEQLWRTLKSAPKPKNDIEPVIVAAETPRISIKEIHLKSETVNFKKDTTTPVVTQPTTSQQTVAQLIASLVQNGVMTRIEFEINQYTLPADWVLPKSIDIASDKKWVLYVVSDPTNARLAREAFARLVSVRSALIKAGAQANQIQLQVKPPPEITTVLPEIERTVFVIERAL
jgi:hypothetical protein